MQAPPISPTKPSTGLPPAGQRITRLLLGALLAPGLALAASATQWFTVRTISFPPGVLDSTSYVTNGSVVNVSPPPMSANGARFTQWTVNGVRQADGVGISSMALALTITAPTEIVAQYTPESQDLDGDQIPDWYEIQQYGNLVMGPEDDSDGDGAGFYDEYLAGTQPKIHDRAADGGIAEGGVSRRRGAMVVLQNVDAPIYYSYTEISNPPGAVGRQEWVPAGTLVTSTAPSLEQWGYRFGQWKVNGVRQETAVGIAVMQTTYLVTQDTAAVAEYVPTTQDLDGDQIPDWYEIQQYGNLVTGPEDDSDGDGAGFYDEYVAGTQPKIHDRAADGGIAEGGVSRRRGAMVALNVSPASDIEPPVITIIGDNPLEIYKGALFTDLGATVTDNVDETRTIAGIGVVDTSTVGFYTLSYTATDAAGNLALPVTRTVNVVLDPASDEDGDGLKNGQELTLGTNPYQKDTDNDGVNDPLEIADGTNPRDSMDVVAINRGLVGYYDGEDFKDRCGNLPELNGKGGASRGSGIVRNGFVLDGFDGGYILPDLAALKLDSFSVAVWFLWNGRTDTHEMILFRGGTRSGFDPFSMEIRTDNCLGVALNHGTDHPCYLISSKEIPIGRWQMAIVTFDAHTKAFNLYLNGDLSDDSISSQIMDRDLEPWEDPGWGIGNHSGNNYFNYAFHGSIDEVRFYNRVIGTEEVNQLYSKGAGLLDTDGDGLTDAWERGYGRYQIIPGAFSATQAKADAAQRGGSMATFTSLAEWQSYLAIYGPITTKVRIGLEASNTEPTGWAWVTGEAGTFRNWDAGQPNGGWGTGETTTVIYDNDSNPLNIWHDFPDNWGLGNFSYLLEFGYPTDPTKADTDGDGFDDKVESLAGTDPNNPNDPTPELSTGLIAFYRFDGNADDSLGNQPPLTLFGSRSFISDGLSGGALRTDGDRSIWYNGGGYFSPAFLENSNLTEATFVFWTRNDASGGPLSPAHTEEAWLEVGYGDTPSISIGARALESSGTFGSVTVNWVDWKMHALTILNTSAGSDWVAYMNGVEYARGSNTDKLLPSPNIKFGSHTWNGGGDRSARMTVEWDNLRIYNKSLSAADIQALYRQDSPNSDNEAPSITLIGDNPLQIFRGALFTDPGATVTDNVDVARTITASGSVDASTVGIYTLTYTAQDAAGNLSLPVTREVRVVLDPNGDEDGDGLTNAQELALGTDPYQKDSQILFTIEGKVQSGTGLTAGQNISISLHAQATYQPNDYYIQTDESNLYWVSEQKGLFSELSGSQIGTRNISADGFSAIGFVEWDPRSPTSRFEVYLDGNGCSFSMSTVLENLLTAPTSSNLNQFFNGKVGTYYPDRNNSSMEWHGPGSSFIATVERIIISNLGGDVQAPVITLIGDSPLEVCKGYFFTDPGATVTDNVDQTRTITGTGIVNTATVGIYTLSYTATDAAGNLALPVTRTVNVVLDPTADEDEDGLSNGTEISGGTNPYERDSDGDGVNDPVEIADGTNPNNASSYNNLNKGLVAFYPFNGNANDWSGNGNHGSIVGSYLSFADRFGVLDRALNLGAGYVRVPSSQSLQMNSQTMTLWLKAGPQINHPAGLISKKTSTQSSATFGHVGLQMHSYDGSVISEWATHQKFVGPIYADQLWHMYTITANNSNGMVSVFIDGVLSGSETYPSLVGANLANQEPLLIGIDREETWRLGGQVDDVRVYNRALSSTEVGQLYENEAGTLDSDGDGLTDAWERGYGRYQLFPSWSYTWDEAKAAAEAKGGHLATITSKSEWDTILSLLGPSLSGVSYQWIGGSDAREEGTWEWVTGEAWSYHRWWQSEPNNYANEDYAWLNSQTEDYEWNDANGSERKGYLLEFGYPTDPFKADTDGDGVNDKAETLAGTDPNSGTSFPDTQSPVITLIGSNPLEVYKDSAFTDPGATVADNKDAGRTITGSGAVDTATVGIYTLTYTAQDQAGNLALPVTRTVNVVLDPALDEDGDGMTNAEELELGTDPYQKDSQILFTIEGKVQSGTDLTPGQNISISLKTQISYSPDDYYYYGDGPFGFSKVWGSTQKNLFSNIRLNQNVLSGFFSNSSYSEMELSGSSYIGEFYVFSEDYSSGQYINVYATGVPLLNSLTTQSSNPNRYLNTKIGTYYPDQYNSNIELNGSSGYLYASIEKITISAVVRDFQAPVITLIGSNPLEVYKGSAFSDPGAIVTDNVDQTRTITSTGIVNTATVGIYTLSYTATDAAGNLALPVTRTVNVVLDPAGDEDGDGLSNSQELTLGTSPYQKDSDGDGVNDPVELADGTNPNDASSYNNLNKGLMAYYPLNGNMEDASGNLRNGINFGGSFGQDRKGANGSALQFNAAAQYGRIPISSDLLQSDFTLTTWVNFISFSNNYPTIFEGQNHYLNMIGMGPIYDANQGKLAFIDYASPQSPRFILYSPTNLIPNKWHYIQLTKAGTTCDLYIDGVLSQSVQGTDAVLQSGSYINLGNQEGFGTINDPNNSECTLFGALDDIRIYNRALSGEEILALYKNQLGPNPVLSLIGSNPIEIYKGTPFIDPGATVVDDNDSGLTVLVSGTVNSGTVGSYTLTYSATDSDGHEATPVTRTVNVVLDPNADEDGDGIPNATELTYGTDPTKPDTDGDGLNDGYEMGYGRYELVTGSFTWDQARLDAEARGGHLLTVSHAQEWQMVQDRLGAEMPSDNYWMGGTDALSEGNWMWITGEQWSYTNWGWDGYYFDDNKSYEPNGGSSANFLAGKISSEINWDWRRWPWDGPSLSAYKTWGDFGEISFGTYILEMGAYSNALNADTDSDGANDAQEIQAGSDPNNSQDTPAFHATPYAGLDVSDDSGLWSFGGPAWTTRLGWSSHDHLDTAVSRSADGQTSWMERTVEGPAYVSFWWRGSSEATYDFYSYTVDGVVQERYSGERGWQRVSLFLAAGSHTVRWSYEKDESEASGEDAVFVDELSVIAAYADLKVSQAGGQVTSPWNIDFGSVLEGSAFVDRIVTLTNEGNLAMTLSVGVPAGSGFQLVNAPNRLEANQSVDVTVRMLTSIVGANSTFLTISAPGSGTPPPLIQLTGEVMPKVPIMELTQGGNLVPSQVSYDLGNLPRTIEFTIRNLGTDILRPVVSVLSGEVRTLAGSVTEVAPGASGTLTLYFSPTTVGAKTAEISLLTNDANRADTRITLTGTSVLPNSGTTGVTFGQAGGGTGWQEGSAGELTVTGGANNSQSYIEATYQGPGLLSWSWKTQVQQGNDALICIVNNQEVVRISTKKGMWEDRVATLPDGVCTVRWVYQKDGILWSGQDKVWLNAIAYRPFEGARISMTQWWTSMGMEVPFVEFWSNPIVIMGSQQVAGGLPGLLAYLGGVNPVSGPVEGEYVPFMANGSFSYRYGINKHAGVYMDQRPLFSSDLAHWTNLGINQRVISEDQDRVVVEISMPTDGQTKGFYRLEAVGTIPQN